MSDFDQAPAEGAPRRNGSIGWALRTAAVAAFGGLLATQYLAGKGAPGEPTRIARAETARPAPDPDTTGSIGDGARSVRLDPCTTFRPARP